MSKAVRDSMGQVLTRIARCILDGTALLDRGEALPDIAISIQAIHSVGLGPVDEEIEVCTTVLEQWCRVLKDDDVTSLLNRALGTDGEDSSSGGMVDLTWHLRAKEGEGDDIDDDDGDGDAKTESSGGGTNETNAALYYEDDDDEEDD